MLIFNIFFIWFLIELHFNFIWYSSCWIAVKIFFQVKRNVKHTFHYLFLQSYTYISINNSNTKAFFSSRIWPPCQESARNLAGSRTRSCAYHPRTASDDQEVPGQVQIAEKVSHRVTMLELSLSQECSQGDGSGPLLPGSHVYIYLTTACWRVGTLSGSSTFRRLLISIGATAACTTQKTFTAATVGGKTRLWNIPPGAIVLNPLLHASWPFNRGLHRLYCSHFLMQSLTPAKLPDPTLPSSTAERESWTPDIVVEAGRKQKYEISPFEQW